MERIINFRELASGVKNKDGKIIKPGTIFRCGTVGSASENDIKELKKRSIKNIYDFRGESELKEVGFLNDAYFVTNHHSILDEASVNTSSYESLSPEIIGKMMVGLYAKKLPNTVKYKNVIDQILKQNEEQFIFHCSAGKDRTGIFGILLMYILDFDIEDIKNEYLQIEQKSIEIMMKKFKNKLPNGNVEDYHILFTITEDFFNSYMIGINESYGNLDNYLEKIGVSNEDKLELRKKYLI